MDKRRKVVLLILTIILLILTACNSSPIDNAKGNENLVENKKVDVDKGNEEVLKETTTSQGYKVKEYIDGYTTILSAENNLDIVRRPESRDFSMFYDHKFEELPVNDGVAFVHDLRSKDISNINLTEELDYLLIADFDDDTIWPDSLPKEYDIEKIKEYGMDPGLGIRKLHEKGINGEGVGIAIIDQTLLVDHIEYKDRIKLYEEIHNIGDFSEMHGPAVASIAVGKNVGIAPESDLYYIAVTNGVYKEGSFNTDLKWIAESIDRIIEINKSLATENKIRVISISLGIDNPELKNQNLVVKAINRAANEGIYTIAVGNSLMGLGREPLLNPNDLNSYKKGYYWRDYDFSIINEKVLAPMDSRCLASFTGDEKYMFNYSGGMSWAVPYTAGLYALSCQVNPNITPEEFNDAVVKTATKIFLDDNEDEYKIVNPEALINSIKK